MIRVLPLLLTFKGWRKLPCLITGVVESFTKAIAIAATPQYYVNRGDANSMWEPKQADMDYAKALGIDPRFITAIAARASLRLSELDYESAISGFTQALLINPESAPVRLQRARAYTETGDLDKASDDVTKILEASPDDTAAMAILGRIHYLLGNDEEAETDFRRALEADPENLDAQEGMAALTKRRDDFSSCNGADLIGYIRIGSCTRYLELDNVRDPILRAEALSNRSDGFGQVPDLTRAFSDLDEAIGLVPNPGRYYASRAALHMQTGDFISAIADYSAAIKPGAGQ